jgi:alkylation response protein AidB-like acyl-CoA dehydrogenase
MNFGSEALKKEIIPEVLAGRKWICLAITEVSISVTASLYRIGTQSRRCLMTQAFAGSDVAGLRTTAVKTPDGKHYIVNGTKVSLSVVHLFLFESILISALSLEQKWITK